MPLNRFLPGLLASFVAMVPAAGDAMEEHVAVASWYGARHQGLRTSTGDVFDQERMTAASGSLPLGSHVRVTMHETGQSVVVLINDRMGARSDKIDLSKGAARQIGLLGRGRGLVSIAPTSAEPVEVAEASEDELGDVASFSSAPRGRRHTRRAAQAAMADRPCCHAPSAVPARH